MNLFNLGLPYLHSIAALIFISLHIGIRMHARYYLVLEEKALKVGIRHLNMQLIFMLICAFIMSLSSLMLSFVSADPIFSTLARTQSALYIFSLVNLLYVLYLLKQSYASLLANKDEIGANEKLTLVIYYFVPLNILLGFVGVLFTLILDSII